MENRRVDILTHIIKKYVKQGSVIHTDIWKGCNHLEVNKYEHFLLVIQKLQGSNRKHACEYYFGCMRVVKEDSDASVKGTGLYHL